ncbi:hypothetical protein AND_009019 [Anopheles darlingi]|uniref:Uncharacterized protein n=1 Tax=Anopheles darlingi TaxID=43151 RepID=W5J9C8_ANODA|nr:uncharacterized protein LOC125952227 [Anopheles darlingi]ETN59389.1 hypothetical protein AND_009019 [Anopheles darlingi]
MEHIPSVRRRSSLFSGNQGSDSSSGSSERAKYEKQLRAEIKEWNDLLRSKYQQLRQMQSKVCSVDQTLLTEEQKRYLADGPSVDKFIGETRDFDQAVEEYIEHKTLLLDWKALIVQEANALVRAKLNSLVFDELNRAPQKRLLGDS